MTWIILSILYESSLIVTGVPLMLHEGKPLLFTWRDMSKIITRTVPERFYYATFTDRLEEKG